MSTQNPEKRRKHACMSDIPGLSATSFTAVPFTNVNFLESSFILRLRVENLNFGEELGG